MRKTTETPAKAFNGKYTTRFTINTALGAGSYSTGQKGPLWKYIFFDNHSQCYPALIEALCGVAGTRCRRGC